MQFLVLIIVNILLSQRMGGHENGDTILIELKSQDLIGQEYLSNVNLFYGTNNLRYLLGSFGMLGNLNYSLGLNYTSNYVGGNNLLVLAEIPYGEEWSVNIPGIANCRAVLKYVKGNNAHFSINAFEKYIETFHND